VFDGGLLRTRTTAVVLDKIALLRTGINAIFKEVPDPKDNTDITPRNNTVLSNRIFSGRRPEVYNVFDTMVAIGEYLALYVAESTCSGKDNGGTTVNTFLLLSPAGVFTRTQWLPETKAP
jgi:hypothetical protein